MASWKALTDLRDESDRTGMRIVIELTRTVDPRDVLAELYKYTPLQHTFGISLLALVDGEPRTAQPQAHPAAFHRAPPGW